MKNEFKEGFAQALYEDLRPEVRRFAFGMELKLSMHDKDRGKSGWLNCDPLWLIKRAREELDEQEKKIMDGESPPEVGFEGNDVGNFAMMATEAYRYQRFHSSQSKPENDEEVERRAKEILKKRYG